MRNVHIAVTVTSAPENEKELHISFQKNCVVSWTLCNLMHENDALHSFVSFAVKYNKRLL